MSVLSDYLEAAELQAIQNMFASIGRAPIRICDPRGDALTAPSFPETPGGPDPGRGETFELPIELHGQTLGLAKMELPGELVEPAADRWSWNQRLLDLMVTMLRSLADRESQLHSRVEDLATLYRLTAEFSSQRDLQGVLDLVVRVVVDVMGAKACSIRLLSDDRKELVVKAVQGLSPEYLDKGPIHLEQSRIDREVIETLKPLYIGDERSDPRVLYPAEARREGIVSALCAPLVYKGAPEGVIRVYMASEYMFDWFEVSLLESIAAQAAAAIVNARLRAEAARSASIQRALHMAAEIQQRMIPRNPPACRGLDIGAVYEPCFELGGDFYDFIDLPRQNLGVAICDVSGKGVRASLLMASIRASLRAHAANIYGLSEVLERVNGDLCKDQLSSEFATLFYGVIDLVGRKFTYANAGHWPPLLVRQGEVRELLTGGTIVGVDPAMHWGYETLTLERGDTLLAYTDGLVEAMNFEDEQFGRARVRQAVLTALELGHDADGIARHVRWEVRRFAGLQTRPDDLTIVAIKVL